MDALSPTGLAWAALTYTLHANPSNKLSPKVHMRLKGVYTRLLRLVRVQGRSAYVAGSIGSQHSAGLEANAIVLLALARAGGEALRTDFASTSAASIPAKLAAYVANGGNDWQSAMFGGGCYVSFVEGDCPKSGEATESFEKLFASGSAASVGEGVVVRAGFLPNIATVLTASACITVALVLFAFRIQKSARPHFKQYLLLHNFRQPYSMQSEFVMDVGGPCLIRTAEEGNPSSPFSGCE